MASHCFQRRAACDGAECSLDINDREILTAPRVRKCGGVSCSVQDFDERVGKCLNAAKSSCGVTFCCLQIAAVHCVLLMLSAARSGGVERSPIVLDCVTYIQITKLGKEDEKEIRNIFCHTHAAPPPSPPHTPPRRTCMDEVPHRNHDCGKDAVRHRRRARRPCARNSQEATRASTSSSSSSSLCVIRKGWVSGRHLSRAGRFKTSLFIPRNLYSTLIKRLCLITRITQFCVENCCNCRAG